MNVIINLLFKFGLLHALHFNIVNIRYYVYRFFTFESTKLTGQIMKIYLQLQVTADDCRRYTVYWSDQVSCAIERWQLYIDLKIK